ncbi:MAG: energy transducer TonB [Acidobacteriota bacterium]|jgi:protein TonB
MGSQQAKPAHAPTPTIPGVVVGSMKGVSDRPAPPPKPNPAEAEVKTSVIVKKEDGQTPNLLPRLLRKVDPEYPELAIRARVEGEVVLKISVNEKGDVSNAEVISGHQLLRQAAVDAVKQWRYEPTVLNGTSIPVSATIRINFVLPENAVTPPEGESIP